MLLFRHGFTRLSPWETRPLPIDAQDLPASDDCLRVGSGRLTLGIRSEPLRTGHVWVPPDRLAVTYGIVRARMRFPSPVGAHGCLWLQDVVPYETPDAHEVDIAEHFGTNKIHHTVHWVDDTGPQKEHYASTRVAEDWAWYEVEIRPEGYQFRINGAVVVTTEVKAPGRPKTLIMSLLSDDWERERYGMRPLPMYRVQCDVVEVTD